MSEKVKFQFPLGVKVKDKVSGLSGTTVARVEHLNGCIQYNVQPECKEGEMDKMPDAWRIDEPQLELLDAPALEIEQKPAGGPSVREPNARA